MIGLVVLVVGVIYLVLLTWATRAAYRWGKSKGFSKAKCWAVAAGGFFAVYLPVFWDHVPTLVSYQYSCATEAGFWEYKTVEQWKSENPGVAATLVSPRVSPSTRRGDRNNNTDTYSLNQRFNWVTKKVGPLPVNRWRWEEEVVDAKTSQVLARSIDFSTGDGSIGWANWPLKFWLKVGYCKGSGLYGGRLGTVVEAAHQLGKKE